MNSSGEFLNSSYKIIILEKIEEIKSNPNIMVVIGNSFWLIFDKLIKMTLGVFVSAWIARYLGPSDYGELAYSLAFLALFQAISTLGLDGIIVREISNNRSLTGKILGTTFFLRVIIGITCWLMSIMIFIAMYGIENRSVYIMALSGASLVFQSLNTIDLWFQSQSQSKRTVVVKLISYIFSSLIKIALIIYEAPLSAFAFVVTVDAIIVGLGLFISYSKYTCEQKWEVEKERGVVLLKESWPFILSGMSTIGYMRLDQFFVKKFIGIEALGIYAAVIPLSMIWSFIPITLFVSLGPMIARKKKESNEEYWKFIINIFRLFSLLGWIICIPIYFVSGFVVETLFGESYILGGEVLSIVIFSNIFINLGIAQSLWVLNEGRAKISLYQTLIGLIVCIVANLILIPLYGINGAAFSAVLAQLFSSILSNILFSKEIFAIQIKSLFLIKHRIRTFSHE